MIGDVLPVLHRGAAQRVSADVYPGLVNGVEVDDIAQVVAVGAAVVVTGDLVAHLRVRLATNSRRIGE